MLHNTLNIPSNSHAPLFAPPPYQTPMLQAKYEASFNEIDTDFDGLVTGANLKETFISFGLESKTLMHIWLGHAPFCLR